MRNLKTMYEGFPFSPPTRIIDPVSETSTIISVENPDVLPEAPNKATLGIDEQGETILYEAKIGNMLSGVTRGYDAKNGYGEAKSWPAGTAIARRFNRDDQDTLQDNVRSIHEDAEEGFEAVNQKISEAVEDGIVPIRRDISRMDQNINTRMPQAPTGAVHGAVEDRWIPLEGTEIRAVVMVSEAVDFTVSDSRVINIPEDQFERFEVFYPTVNGASVRIEKEPMQQTLYQVGRDFVHYAFEYDGENRRIVVRQMGIAASNPNILHNWDFRNPVNQRGVLEYSIANVYTIDRWLTRGFPGMLITPEGINITGNVVDSVGGGMEQVIENPLIPGTIVTASAMIDGNIYSVTFPWTDSIGMIRAVELNSDWHVALRRNTFQFNRHGGTPDMLLQAVKLEIGPISTLANDPPMDFGRELAVCQRYQRLLVAELGAHGRGIRSFAPQWHVIHFDIPGTTMRITPQIVYLQNGILKVVREPSGPAEAGFTFRPRLQGEAVRIDAVKQGHGVTDAHLSLQGRVLLDANL